MVCGIDEAGRGPVLGPLVMAGVSIEEDKLVRLEEMGVKDSKLLTKEKREDLFDKIKEIADSFEIKIVSPIEIDEALVGISSNLNWLEADTSSIIINSLNPDKIIVDCPSVNISAYENYLRKKLGGVAEMVVEHKADLNYVVVGAASILAKVTRDRELEKMKKKWKVNFGSGYLTDEKTQNFLKENFDNSDYEGFFRKMWAPYQKLIQEKEQKKLGEF